MKYVIGIDGGGTKTMGYLGTVAGKILAKTLSGPSNYHSIGIDKTRQSISDVIESLCYKGNINKSDIKLMTLGLAGIDRPQDKEIIRGVIRGIDIKAKTILVNDAKTALIGAHGKEYGIITISGTGSISFGVDLNGDTFRAGGWGHIIDDEGSGYDIGRQALSAIFKAYDHRGEKTILTEKVLKFLSLKTVEEVIGYIYCKEISKDHIAQIAPIVFESVYSKDLVATRILDKAANSLAEITETVIRNLFFGKQIINIAIDGGILRKNEYLENEFRKKLNNRIKNVDISMPLFNGAIGALLMGLNELKINYSLDNLKTQIKEMS